MGNNCCSSRSTRPVNHVPRNVFVNVITPPDLWDQIRSTASSEEATKDEEKSSALMQRYAAGKERVEESLEELRKIVEIMARPSFSKSEVLKSYKEFVKKQNELVKVIEKLIASGDFVHLRGKLIRQAQVTNKFTSSIGDTYSVAYVPSSDAEKKTDKISEMTEHAVKRERICYFDFFNLDPVECETLTVSMQKVPDASVVFDSRYQSFRKKEVIVKDEPFQDDANAPPLGCCGGCCAPRRKYVKYTLTRDPDDKNSEKKNLFLYMNPNDESE